MLEKTMMAMTSALICSIPNKAPGDGFGCHFAATVRENVVEPLSIGNQPGERGGIANLKLDPADFV
jgi:hypothetical protein